MACSVVRTPLLRNPTVRHYAVAAAAQANVAHQTAPECQVLNNKVTVAAVDNNSPVTQVTIVFRAGSRNETYDTQGIAHHLRIAAGLGTKRSSAFGITRNIQQLGGNLTATTDRESIAYTLQITKDHVGTALKFLEDVATNQVFKPWEISDQIPRLRYEISNIPETTRVIELLHKAAYHSGLGYSLYSPKRQLGKIGTESLQHFANTWLTESRCAVVASGMSLSEVSAFATNLNIASGTAQNEPSPYHGGEIRKERNSQLATVALAVEGGSLKNDKESLAFAVLQRAVGCGRRVKWGSVAATTCKEILAAGGSEPCVVSAFNASYTDSGLFGFVICAQPAAAGSITKAAHKWLKSPSVSDADVARGKTMLKADILSVGDSNSLLTDDMAQQAIHRGKVSSIAAIVAEVDKITASDVNSVASKLSNKRLSLAAIGDLRMVPYINELN